MKFLITLIILGVLWSLFGILYPQISTTITDNKNNEVELKFAQEYLSKFKTNISLPNKKVDVYVFSKTHSHETGIGEESVYILSA